CPIGLEGGPFESPRPGDHGAAPRTAREGPQSERRAFVENSTAASVRECPLSAKRARGGVTSIVSCGRSLDDIGIVRKVASRKLSSSSTSHSGSTYSGRRISQFALARRSVKKCRMAKSSRREEEEEDALGMTAASPRPTQLRPGGSRKKKKDTRRR
ncbi:hypothetical protein THAOC_22588, partial [Thalassiosira oceanica]